MIAGVPHEALLGISLYWRLILALLLIGGEFSHGLDPKATSVILTRGLTDANFAGARFLASGA
jgi:hypothetical protein